VRTKESLESKGQRAADASPSSRPPNVARNRSRLTRSDQLLQDLFRAATEGIAVYADKVVIAANDAFAHMYGFADASEVIGTQLRDLLAPHAREGAIAAKTDNGQFECMRLDGSLMITESRGAEIVFEGQKARVMAVRDVTERKRTEEELREVTTRFRIAFESAPNGIALVGIDGQLLQVNPALCEIFGRSAEDLLQRTFQGVVHLNDLEANLEVQRQFLDGTLSTTTFEKRYTHTDGHVVWVNLSSSLVRDDDGKPLHFITHVKDITDRKNAEHDLQAQAATLQLLQRVAVAANEASEPAHAFATALEAVCEHTGWSAGHVYVAVGETGTEELVSSGIWHCDDPAAFERFREITESVRFQPGAGLPGRTLATGRPSSWADEQGAIHVGRVAAGLALGLQAAFAFPVLIGRETVAVLEFYSRIPGEPDSKMLDLMSNIGTQLGRVLERARAKDLQEELDTARARFVANAAHELRTPLATLRTVAALLGTRRQEMTAAELEECFDMMQRQGENLEGLVNELLDLSRIEHGDVDLYFEAVPAERWLTRALETAPAPSHLRVNTRIDGEPAVYANPERLNRVLVNLLTNAYRAASTTVAISVEHQDTELVLTIVDDGLGIDPDLVGQIFEPFTRGKSEQSGAGLGLAITRRIVEDLGGRITYDGRERGGARFVVRLPSASPPVTR
jgi:PAS domain S-box-containing protein